MHVTISERFTALKFIPPLLPTKRFVGNYTTVMLATPPSPDVNVDATDGATANAASAAVVSSVAGTGMEVDTHATPSTVTDNAHGPGTPIAGAVAAETTADESPARQLTRKRSRGKTSMARRQRRADRPRGKRCSRRWHRHANLEPGANRRWHRSVRAKGSGRHIQRHRAACASSTAARGGLGGRRRRC